eukprot:2404315-Karenia_brevis.AAC.1
MTWVFLVSWNALEDVLEVSCGMLGVSLLSWAVLGGLGGLWGFCGCSCGGLGGSLGGSGRALGTILKALW